MVSDPSALLLLKYGIPYHKSSETLHLRSNLGHKLVHGAGAAHARSAQTVKVVPDSPAYVQKVTIFRHVKK